MLEQKKCCAAGVAAKTAATALLFLLLAAGRGACGEDGNGLLLLAGPRPSVALLEMRHSRLSPGTFIHCGNAGEDFDPSRAAVVEGMVRGAFYDGGNLILVFDGSVHEFDPGKRKSRMLLCAGRGEKFLAACGNAAELFGLLRDREGTIRILRSNGRDAIPGPEGASRKEAAAFSSAALMALTWEEEVGLRRIFVADLRGAAPVESTGEIRDFSFLTFANLDGTPVLLPQKGISALRWTAADAVLATMDLPPLPRASGRWAALCGAGGDRLLMIEDSGGELFIHGPGIAADGKKLFQKQKATGKELLSRILPLPVIILIAMVVVLVMLRKRRRGGMPRSSDGAFQGDPPRPCHLLVRALAFLLDITLILQPVVFGVNYLIFGETGLDLDLDISRLNEYVSDPTAMREILPAAMSFTIIRLIIVIMYQWTMEYFFSASIGKMLLRIKVVRDDGGNPTPSQIAARNLCRVLDFFMGVPVGMVSCMISRKNKCFGDRLAGTVVAEDTEDIG